MNFAKYRVQLSTEKSTRVSTSTSTSMSTPSLLFSYVALILCIDRYSCLLKPSREVMSNNARASIFIACIILGTLATNHNPFFANFDVHVGLVHVQYLSIFDVLIRILFI